MADAGGGIVYLDFEDGLKRVMNNTNLYLKLLTKFKTGANLDALLAALTAEDFTQAQIQAHTLKGIAGNLSLAELYRQSQAVETRIKNKTVDAVTIESLKTCFKDTIANIERVITEHGEK